MPSAFVIASHRVVCSSNHLVGPHHLVVLVLEDVAVKGVSERLVAPHERARRELEFDQQPDDFSGTGLHGVLQAEPFMVWRGSGRTGENQ